MSTDADAGTEVWGRCEVCDRWFYCGHGEGAVTASSECPVCATPPAQIDLRLVGLSL